MQQHPPVETPELPSLDPGITLLETPDTHGIEAIQTLVIDHVLLHEGDGYWIDSGQHAVTSHMRDLAPSDRILERIHVARGFTPYQHTALIRRLKTGLRSSPSLIVIPAVDYHYRSDDLRGIDSQEMLTRALAEIAALARTHEVPLLVTREQADAFSQSIERLADNILEYRDTKYGPRFDGENVETYLYDLDGAWVQTTWAFWREVLDAREPLYDDQAASDYVQTA
jgi:hypothetical protein